MEKFFISIDNSEIIALDSEFRLAVKLSYYITPQKYDPILHDSKEYLLNHPNEAKNIFINLFKKICNKYAQIEKEYQEKFHYNSKIKDERIIDNSFIMKVLVDCMNGLEIIKSDNSFNRFKIKVYNIRNGYWNNNGIRYIGYFGMKGCIYDIETNEEYPILLFMDNQFRAIYEPKKRSKLKVFKIKFKYCCRRFKRNHFKLKLI